MDLELASIGLSERGEGGLVAGNGRSDKVGFVRAALRVWGLGVHELLSSWS
jgi:hypothetical protein